MVGTFNKQQHDSILTVVGWALSMHLLGLASNMQPRRWRLRSTVEYEVTLTRDSNCFFHNRNQTTSVNDPWFVNSETRAAKPQNSFLFPP